jgi:hypothetical protein
MMKYIQAFANGFAEGLGSGFGWLTIAVVAYILWALFLK